MMADEFIFSGRKLSNFFKGKGGGYIFLNPHPPGAG